MELVRFCVYCGNETNGSYCKGCQEYDGIVDGLKDDKGDIREFHTSVCDSCKQLTECAEIGDKTLCVECMTEKGML